MRVPKVPGCSPKTQEVACNLPLEVLIASRVAGPGNRFGSPGTRFGRSIWERRGTEA
jgi:hypothetical protein